MPNTPKAYLAVFVSTLLVFTASTSRLEAQEPARLKIIIIEGEGATNNIKQRTAREPIVEVQDENNRPVGGALVTFALPNYGASGTFQGGSKLLSVTTDANGRAVGKGFQPNTAKGNLKIQVRAQSNGQSASAEINSVNVGPGMTPTAKWATIGAIAAGAVVAAVVATTTGGNNNPATQPPTTISAGPGVVR
jgi:hypothetical protein